MTLPQYELHNQLAEDTETVGSLDLCDVLMHKDTRTPWLILVPKRANIREIHHLEMPDQLQLMKESSAVAQAMEDAFQPDKLNVASLGNMVPQLHVHVVARREGDIAWPGPIWGVGGAEESMADMEVIKRQWEVMRGVLMEARTLLESTKGSLKLKIPKKS